MMVNKRIFLGILFLGMVVILGSCDKKEDDNKPSVNENATQFVESDGGKTITVIDKGEGVGNYTFTADKTWILQGFVFVNENQTLKIEAGTLIKGKPGQGENASALIVARGGKINAVGTAAKPIVFTSESDNYEGTGVPKDAKGLWGGIIILGKATTNNLTTDKAIEGIPTSEKRGLYGGNNDNDNSGTLKYVSIRHGGTDIGEGNEINGLTLGAVGSATTIEYIEVIANKDDGIEFFGGAPQLKYILVTGCGDDSYDYDQGFHGKGQFWCTVQSSDGDRMGEHDGGPSDNETGTPYATPTVFNATYVGNGSGKVITFRDNAGGTYANSIFVNQKKSIDIEYLQDESNKMVGCSFKMFENNKLNIKNSVFYDIAGVKSETGDFAKSLFKVGVPKDKDDKPLYACPAAKIDAWANTFKGNNNSVADPGVSATNVVPTTPQTSDLAVTTDPFFTQVTYKGAFGSDNWAKGWTLFLK